MSNLDRNMYVRIQDSKICTGLLGWILEGQKLKKWKAETLNNWKTLVCWETRGPRSLLWIQFFSSSTIYTIWWFLFPIYGKPPTSIYIYIHIYIYKSVEADMGNWSTGWCIGTVIIGVWVCICIYLYMPLYIWYPPKRGPKISTWKLYPEIV